MKRLQKLIKSTKECFGLPSNNLTTSTSTPNLPLANSNIELINQAKVISVSTPNLEVQVQANSMIDELTNTSLNERTNVELVENNDVPLIPNSQEELTITPTEENLDQVELSEDDESSELKTSSGEQEQSQIYNAQE
jgi:hypothetical protein